MGNEESPQITRRATRLSSSTPVTSNEVETEKITKPYKLTVNDFVFGGEKLSFDDLLSSFPARGNQIRELLRLLGPVNSPMLPLFVYGDPSTGKTSSILQIFRHLNRPFVYASCLTCYSLQILFESVLDQLLLHKKNAANGYSSARRCVKPSDFVNFLRGDLTSVIEKLKSLKKVGPNKSAGKPNGNMLYLIFDNLELIREWDKSSTALSFMFNLYDVLKMHELGLIFISNTSPDTYYSNMGYTEHVPVYFPEYTEDDLRQILMRNQPNRKLYSSFLDVVLRPFCRTTRRVDELSTAFSSLFRKYCEPLSDLASSSTEAETNKDTTLKGSTRKSEVGDHFAQIDFHMSTSAKYLLISAFLASRNPATLDASLFDSTGGSDSRKRKRKASEKSIEQKEVAEQELLMKGPGTFPLERLLAIFQCITSAADSFDEDEHENDDLRAGGDGGLMSDVLLQLSSLCNANFIIKGGSCPLEGSTRYRSTVSEDLALKVARSLKFPLPNYLYRR
ncbi:hypothetical protein OIU78_015682 [Salix suchowensis]|nr:hypothetical protein OIU78_015682 [Salix suchowensis]